MPASRTYVTAITSPPTALNTSFSFEVQDPDLLHLGSAYIFSPKSSGPDPDDPFTRVEVDITSITGNVVAATATWSLTATPRTIKANDFIQMARANIGVTPVMTVPGIQSVHDTLQAQGGGTMVWDDDSPVPPYATALHLWGDNIEIICPKSSPMQMTAGLGRYTVANIGNNITMSTRTWTAVQADYGSRYMTITSLTGADDIPGPAFAKGDYVLAGFAGTTIFNRIHNIVGLVVEFERPLATTIPVTGVIATTGILRRITGVTENLRIRGLRFDNNGNTNPGVSTTYTPTATTQLTADTATSATIQVASSAGFTAGQYVVIDYNGVVQAGESKGFVIGIVSIPDGTHIELAGPPPNVVASGATVQEVAGTDLAVNVGAVARYTAHSKFEDIDGSEILGSNWDDWFGWENSYKDMEAYHCGFQYQTQWGFAQQWVVHTGSNFINCHSESSLSRGIYTSLLFQCLGAFTSAGAHSRGVHMDATRQCSLVLQAYNGTSTGVILANNAYDNDITVFAAANDAQGFVFETSAAADACNDNSLHVLARDNTTGDVQVNSWDLRNKVEVLNDDAVVVDNSINRAARRPTYSYHPQAPVDIQTSAAETVICQFTVGKGTMFANSGFRVGLNHVIFNNKGSNGTVTYRIYTNAGATKVFEAVSPALASGAANFFAGNLDFEWGNANGLSVQRGGGYLSLSGVSDVAVGYGATVAAPLLNTAIAIAGRTDPSATQDIVFKVTAQLSAADVNFILNVLRPTVVFIP